MAILLILPWIMPYFLSKQKTTKASSELSLLHSGIHKLEAAFSNNTINKKNTRSLYRFLLFLLWISIIITLMRPQIIKEYTEVRNRGYDLMLAVDVSRSMLALDFKYNDHPVNRLAVVKGVLDQFISKRTGDRVGLILFGDGAYVQSPLTSDGNIVRNMLKNTIPRVAGDGTAIGDAIGLAVKKLRHRPAGSRILILLTDGENTSGSLAPLDATMLAKQYNIRIYTIGVGSEGEVPFPGENGKTTLEKMELDEDLLKNIAHKTNGVYHRATDTEALENIYKKINSLEKTEAETKSVMIPQSIYRWPLSLTLLCLLIIAGLSLGRGGKW
ncbi:MAG: VWA domain-containing protein [Methylococcales bacterium]|nr:VWA domain-containing protein [Methylococcales bacterium]